MMPSTIKSHRISRKTRAALRRINGRIRNGKSHWVWQLPFVALTRRLSNFKTSPSFEPSHQDNNISSLPYHHNSFLAAHRSHPSPFPTETYQRSFGHTASLCPSKISRLSVSYYRSSEPLLTGIVRLPAPSSRTQLRPLHTFSCMRERMRLSARAFPAFPCFLSLKLLC